MMSEKEPTQDTEPQTVTVCIEKDESKNEPVAVEEKQPKASSSGQECSHDASAEEKDVKPEREQGTQNDRLSSQGPSAKEELQLPAPAAEKQGPSPDKEEAKGETKEAESKPPSSAQEVSSQKPASDADLSQESETQDKVAQEKDVKSKTLDPVLGDTVKEPTAHDAEQDKSVTKPSDGQGEKSPDISQHAIGRLSSASGGAELKSSGGTLGASAKQDQSEGGVKSTKNVNESTVEEKSPSAAQEVPPPTQEAVDKNAAGHDVNQAKNLGTKPSDGEEDKKSTEATKDVSFKQVECSDEKTAVAAKQDQPQDQLMCASNEDRPKVEDGKSPGVAQEAPKCSSDIEDSDDDVQIIDVSPVTSRKDPLPPAKRKSDMPPPTKPKAAKNEPDARPSKASVEGGVPQDRPIIDPKTYHTKFCLPRRKKKKNQSMSIKPKPKPKQPDEMEKTKPNANEAARSKNMDPPRTSLAKMSDNMEGGMSAAKMSMMDNMDMEEMLSKMPPNMRGNMMESMKRRMMDEMSGNMGMGGGMMRMNSGRMGNNGMGMDMDGMGFSPNEGMGGMMMPNSRMGMMGMNNMMSNNFMMQMMGGGSNNMMGNKMMGRDNMGMGYMGNGMFDQMRGNSNGSHRMGDFDGQQPSNLQEMREMMGRDTDMSMMDQMGNGMFNRSRSRGGANSNNAKMDQQGLDDSKPGNLMELREMMGRDMGMNRRGNGMFNPMSSRGSANSNNAVASKDQQGMDGGKNKPGNLMELREMMGRDMDTKADRAGNGMFNSMVSRGSTKDNNTNTNNKDQKGDSMLDRLGSGDTGKASRGSPGIPEEDYMRQPMLPTPAEIKPSFKKTYKEISFSPLDRLDRNLMKRMMATHDPTTDPIGGGMMPPLPTNAQKCKFSDLAYSPRSPNPKKSFLERHRMMDMEMKGYLEEAMQNFGRFQRKYSGGSGGNGPTMASNNPSVMEATTESSLVPTGVPLKAAKKNEVTTKSSSKDKKADAKKLKDKKSKKPDKKAKSKKSGNVKEPDDPRRPKRPFSAYNIFFQLERAAIVARADQKRDPLKDKIEPEYRKKVESGEVSDEDTPLDPVPHNPDIHEPNNPATPARYKGIRLDKDWYRASAKSKRKHRKSEGASVPFLELTKMISRRWAAVDDFDPDIKKFCSKLAQEELENYKAAMEKYKEMVEEERKRGIDASGGDSSIDSDDDSTEPKQKASKTAEQKRPKQADKPPVNDLDIGSQTPRAFREALFDPQFSSRLTDLSRFSNIFPHGTPIDFGGDPSMVSNTPGGSSLPPPPLFADKNNNNDSSERGTNQRMAAMTEAEERFASNSRGGGGGSRMNANNRGGDDSGDRTAALADARRRMQMDMQSMGNVGQMMGDFPRGMPGMMNNMSDFAQYPNMQQNMMMNMNKNFFPSGGGDGDNMMNSMMRERFMDRFANNPDNMPQNDDDFDAEVERFLSCLGKEIKDNRRQRNNMNMDAPRGGGGGRMGGFNDGNAMMNRMMMMEQMMMNRNGGGGNGNMNFSQMQNFRQQMGNDNPQLPEFGDFGPNVNSRNAN